MCVYLNGLNKAIKAHDRDLYAKVCKDGVVRVIQKVRKGFTLTGEEWLVCSLTDTWGSQGKPRDWGILPVLDHIKFGSLERRDESLRELNKSQEQAQESRSRAAKTIAEDCASEMRNDMKKAFSDTLTHSMDMSKDPRRKTEKSKRSL